MENKSVATVFRFNFESNVAELVTEFAKIHEHDDAKDYKEAWNAWCDEQKDVIQAETRRLGELGYTGDVIDKMYKAGRYYFRNKKTVKAAPKTRRNYISLNGAVISLMDTHISDNIKNADFTPANAYELFVEKERKTITKEVMRLNNVLKEEDDKLDGEGVANKIKKTYKNRYFIISRKSREDESS